MGTNSFRLIAIPLIVLGLGVTACAKRPGTADSSAPSPMGAGGSRGGQGQMGRGQGQMGEAHMGQGQAGYSSEEAQRWGTGGGGTRPTPREYTTMPDMEDIYFDFDRADIRSDAVPVLDANAAWLKSNPGTLLLIEGHTDERGTNEYNLALGDRRARAARNYLVAQGVAASRITLISYGESRGMCAASTEHCWTMNRRAHFAVRTR